MFRRLKERIMVGEPHVDDPPLLPDGILDKGKKKVAVVFYLVNLPDYVVSEAETVEYLVKARKASACGKRCFHSRPLKRL
jgi:hypothetical protein